MRALRKVSFPNLGLRNFQIFTFSKFFAALNFLDILNTERHWLPKDINFVKSHVAVNLTFAKVP